MADKRTREPFDCFFFRCSFAAQNGGREATVFVSKSEKSKITYNDIASALRQEKNAKFKIGYTIEFYPEEGKYHFTGHRNCNFVQSPGQTRDSGNICPVCNKPLTIGVMHRVEELANNHLVPKESSKLNPNGVKWVLDPNKKHPPFVKLVPLNEILAESLFSTVSSGKVMVLFDTLCKTFGSELNVLLRVPIKDIEKEAGERVAEGIGKVRKGDIVILPVLTDNTESLKFGRTEKSTTNIRRRLINWELTFRSSHYTLILDNEGR